MGTGIAYVDETWNPVVGCSKISIGCKFCYAEKMAYRLACMGIPRYDMVQDEGIWNGNVELNHEALDKPLHWRQPRRILVPSMGDLFHEKVNGAFVGDIFDVIRKTPRHKYLILTKRVERMKTVAEMLIAGHGEKYLNHVHWGVTICTQKEADEKIPILLQIPAVYRWLSIEPMLEAIDLTAIDLKRIWPFKEETEKYNVLRGYGCSVRKSEPKGCRYIDTTKNKIDGVVIGCESGPKRRPCKLEHIRSIVEQCKAASVGCFVKQIEINDRVSHKPEEWPKWAQVREPI